VKTSPRYCFQPLSLRSRVFFAVSGVSGMEVAGERVPPHLPPAPSRRAAYVAVALQAWASQRRNAYRWASVSRFETSGLPFPDFQCSWKIFAAAP
jgi:hypothetical protein